MKKKYLLLVLLFMAASEVTMASEVQTGDSIIGDFLRGANGEIITNVVHKRAIDACERLGMRLPTAREVAREGVKIGGAALVEVNDYDAGEIPQGYTKEDFYFIKTMEVDKSIDQFYYAHKNYRRPAGDLGNYRIWSSSLLPYPQTFAVLLSGRSGYVYFGERIFNSEDAGIRCVARVNR